jgi:chromosome segregation ATPase
VTSPFSLASRRRLVEFQAGKLDACDESLTLIASDVAELQEEVALLREEADRLAQKLSGSELARREATERAEAFARSLEEAETRLARAVEHVVAVEQERDVLRARVGDAERRADAVGAECAREREAGARLRSDADELIRRLSETEVARQTEAERVATLFATVEQAEVRLGHAAAQAAALQRERDEAHTTAESERMRSARLAEELDAARVARQAAEAAYPSAWPRPVDETGLSAPPPTAGHVRVAALPGGNRVSESWEPLCLPGDVVNVDGIRCVVSAIGRSPTPGDPRPCAFLVPLLS